MDRSFTFSILKTAYGWNGCTKTAEQMNALDAITKKHDCERCAAREMAAYIQDHCGADYFRKRLDGKANTYSVERDRAGQTHQHLN